VDRRRIIDDVGGWAVEERLGEAETDSTRAYYFQDQLAIRHELDSKVAARVAGLTLVEKDIRNIVSWVDALRELLVALGASEEETTMYLMPKEASLAAKIVTARALYVAIATTYGKLFVSAEGRSTSLDAKAWVGKEHEAAHQHLIHTRHTFTAHSGKGTESCRAVVAIDHSQSDRTLPRIFTELHQPTFVGLPELKAIEELLVDLQSRVKVAAGKATTALYAEVRNTFTPGKLRFLRMGAPGTRLVRK
jgi:hypothetical protein